MASIAHDTEHPDRVADTVANMIKGRINASFNDSREVQRDLFNNVHGAVSQPETGAHGAVEQARLYSND
jgi:hypothetical protein